MVTELRSPEGSLRQRTTRWWRAGMVLALAVAALLLASCEGEDITSLPEANCGPTAVADAGFEDATLASWNPQDMAVPFEPLRTEMAGIVTGCCGGGLTTAPSEGLWATVMSFDGGGPDTVRISQDVTLSACATVLAFDYWLSWDLFNFASPGALSRTFNVSVEPAGGGTPFQVTNIVTASYGTVVDTGIVPGFVDVAPFQGQTVRVAFENFIPEPSTGPGVMQLDNIRIF